MKKRFISKQTLVFVLFCLGFTFSLFLPFTPLAAQSWTRQGTPINGAAALDQSGFSVSLSSDGTTVAIGAPYNDGGGTDAGHVRVLNYAVALPVELLSFSGKHIPPFGGQGAGGNLLTWTTANEVNNKGFEIQRSPQPPKGAFPTWETIGTVNAKGKAATYEFTDKAPFGGWGLYRLRQIDFDGKETYSKVISIVSPFGGKGAKVYPTITSGTLTIEGAKSFELINAIGQVVLYEKGLLNFESLVNLTLTHLPNGIYILKGVNTEGGVFAEKIIKQ